MAHHYFKAIISFVFVLFVLIKPVCCYSAVLPGIDVLSANNFHILQNRRVGLITNHTGHSVSGVSTIDLLHNAPGVKLVALFSPEHGIRGESDEKISSGFDVKTGLQVHSLYGKSCRPTPEMLQGIDVLVFDIQDIGTRFYTYIGTLSLAMRSAKEAGIPFVVLDRPNPIGGDKVQGSIPTISLSERKNGCGAITSIHPIPTRHGMTVGELAQLFNMEYGIGCSLTVIPMQGWKRSMYYDQTGLVWINPSPNMKNLNAALLYPGPGTLETTNLSVGRGTEKAFMAYGAPWVDSAAVVKAIAARNIPGLKFETCSFIPTTPGFSYKGTTCYGICLTVLDRVVFDPVLAGLHLVKAFYEIHPQRFRAYEGFATELGDRDAWGEVTKGSIKPEKVIERWSDSLNHFRELRKRYLIYTD